MSPEITETSACEVELPPRLDFDVQEAGASPEWRSLAEDTEDMIVRWTPDGTRLYVNPAYAAHFGKSQDEMAGTSLRESMTADEWEDLEGRVSQLSPRHPLAEHERQLTTPRGLVRWHEWKSRGVFDMTGRLTEIQSVGRDVTDRREVELCFEEIAQGLVNIRGERFFEHLAGHLARVLEADCCLVGELIGAAGVVRPLCVITGGKSAAAEPFSVAGTPFETVLKEGSVNVADALEDRYPRWPAVKAAGFRSCLGTTMTDATGQPLGVAVAFFNRPLGSCRMKEAMLRVCTAVGSAELMHLQELKRRQGLEQQLRQAQKMEAVGRLAGGIAHDFNNLLTIILGHAAMLKDGRFAQITTSAADISAAAERAAALTRQLLAFSRRQNLQFRRHDLNELVLHLGRMLRRLVEEAIELQVDVHHDIIPIMADRGMLEQVLLNLVVNARDATPPGGRIDISTAIHEGCAHIIVKDTGCGIPKENLERIFEPFFTTKKSGDGNGLGLATAYAIVEKHDGRIEVQSEEGKGSTFTVILPIATPTEGHESANTAQQPELGRGETILLVEDEAPLRALVRRLLTSFGYRVIEAASGRRAVEIDDDSLAEVDLVLTDLVMPEGLTGCEAAEKLRERRPGLRVLFTSGYSAESAGKDIDPHRDYGFLPKPYEPQQLAHAIRALLDGPATIQGTISAATGNLPA